MKTNSSALFILKHHCKLLLRQGKYTHMKKTIIPVLAVFLAFAAQAQSEKFMAAMKKNLVVLDSAKTTDDLQNAANNFERITTVEKDQWQPYYYAAYALVMKSFYAKDKLSIDPNCDKADELLAMAESLSPGNAEITTLKSMVLSARMQVDNSRYMTMGQKSGMLLEEAVKQQSDNPRALMQMAQSKFYTPPAFGGGKDKGIEWIKKSLAAYDSFKPATDIDPNWGKAYAQSLLDQWSK
jgi:hypothetical protein